VARAIGRQIGNEQQGLAAALLVVIHRDVAGSNFRHGRLRIEIFIHPAGWRRPAFVGTPRTVVETSIRPSSRKRGLSLIRWREPCDQLARYRTSAFARSSSALRRLRRTRPRAAAQRKLPGLRSLAAKNTKIRVALFLIAHVIDSDDAAS